MAAPPPAGAPAIRAQVQRPARPPTLQAVKIALELKKHFVDSNKLDVTQVTAGRGRAAGGPLPVARWAGDGGRAEPAAAAAARGDHAARARSGNAALAPGAQPELEAVLFGIMGARGFDEPYIRCYRMVTAFYQQRQPLVILICGTAWTGGAARAGGSGVGLD
jgi:hypothetical protein